MLGQLSGLYLSDYIESAGGGGSISGAETYSQLSYMVL